MAKTERLFALLDALRRRRAPVSAETLSREMGVSTRTIYRDMASLMSLGVPVEGESGMGYVLRPGYFLPPLMFDPTELEALVAGVRWVQQLPDKPLALAAANALAKIAAANPDGIGSRDDDVAIYVSPNEPLPDELPALPLVRAAMRDRRKLAITYVKDDVLSQRTIWPLATAFYDRPMLAAWCELRCDYRTFAIDRIKAVTPLDECIPDHRIKLFRQYLARFETTDP
jgi:predicted DNA-binding transcriptional regulator YafY